MKFPDEAENEKKLNAKINREKKKNRVKSKKSTSLEPTMVHETGIFKRQGKFESYM